MKRRMLLRMLSAIPFVGLVAVRRLRYNLPTEWDHACLHDGKVLFFPEGGVLPWPGPATPIGPESVTRKVATAYKRGHPANDGSLFAVDTYRFLVDDGQWSGVRLELASRTAHKTAAAAIEALFV